ncbi:MAG: hypothetical protein PHY28_10420 [Dehalococcoidales bacterium]|nr:hypothetical protein [Dehalococcoidales bacterium]
MAGNNDFSRQLNIAKIMSIVFLIASFVYIDVLWYTVKNGIAPVWTDPDQGQLLRLVTIVLAVISLSCIGLGFYFPKYIIRHSSAIKRVSLLTSNILSFSFFEAISIYGLILGLLSAKWEISLPFFAVSIIAMLLSFPTRTKWENVLKAKQ